MRLKLFGLSLTVWYTLVPTSAATPNPPSRIRLGLDSRRAAASVAFGPNGNLYVAYRKVDERKSSAIALAVFDGKTGKQLMRSEIATEPLQLPQWASTFEVSLNGALLLYFETPAALGPPNRPYLAVIDSAKLSLVSSRYIEQPAFPNVRAFGFSTDSQSIVLGSAEENRVPGGSPTTKELRITRLNAHDLREVNSDRVVQNPFQSYGYMIDADAVPWFSKENFIPRSFYRYDPESRRVLEGIQVENIFGLLGPNLFLKHGMLSFTDEAGDAGQVFLFRTPSEAPVRTVRVTGCGFKNAAISTDGALVAAICVTRGQAEFTFGSITACKLSVFRVETLQNIATMPCSKDTVWHPVAVWHETGHVRVATVDATGTLSVYKISD